MSYLTALVLFINCIGVSSDKIWIAAETLDFQQRNSIEDYESDEPRPILVRHRVNVINSTSTQIGGQYGDITVTVTAFNEIHVLDLSLNRRLFSADYIEKTITNAGEKYYNVNHSQNGSHCFYLGTVRDRAQSTAAISTCKGIIGYFAIGNVSYHIEPQSNHLHGHHIVYRSLPNANANATYRCGSDHIILDNLMKSAKSRSRVKRSFSWPQDEDKKDKVVELYVVNDYSQFKARGNDIAAVFQRAKDIVNIASSSYQVLGIYLVLVGIEVWSETDMFLISSTDDTSVLNNLYDYRKKRINPFHYNDNAILLTNTPFQNGVIGKAIVGSMCSNLYSGSLVCDIYRSAALAGSTLAHELGHNFGLVHDSDSCSCLDKSGHCIMYPSANSLRPATNWSSCSQEEMSRAFQEGLDVCLHDVPEPIFQPSTSFCGNGIVETGEQCDCGRAPSEECNIACCNSTTCRLIGFASCASGRCCDIAKCQIRQVGTQCRTKSDDCDLTEVCDGVQSLCPANTYKPDGTSCTVNQESAYCYQGRCRSHSSQCELVWGSGTRSSNAICYARFNVVGLQYGNCGLNWLPAVSYIPCQQRDVMCGKLQCDDNQRAVANYRNVYKLSTASIGSYSCHSVIFDYGLRTQDPGLVPSGAKCGDGKMCVSQKCVDVSSIKNPQCSGNCGPGEVCNNLGQCQNDVFSSSTTTSTTPQSSTSTSTKTSTTSSTTRPTTSTTSTTTSTTKTSTTSTTWSTTSTAKSTTRTATLDPGQANEGAVGVYLGKTQTGASRPLQFDGALANRLSRYNFSSDSFRSRLNSVSQFLYTEICAGVLASTTAQLRTTGAFPPLSFDWMSTAQNGVDSGCRGGVLSASRIVSISISQNGSGVYSSSNQKETSWSVFSITDTMKYASQLLCVFGSRSSFRYGALPSLSPLVNPVSPVRLYNAATTAYSCASDASAYFFSMSVGVPAGRTATVQLAINGMDYTFEMTRQNTLTTGVTTLARTVLVPCTSDARMLLTDGNVVPGSNLISFTAFPYELKTGTSVSWSGYRTRDVLDSGTITYDLWLVRKEINFQVENSVLQIPVRGYYYVYISAGVGQGKSLSLSVTVNGNSLFGLTRMATDHNGIDTIGHGMVVLLSANDQLRVDAGTTTFSSSNGLHTSFIGMFLYQE